MQRISHRYKPGRTLDKLLGTADVLRNSRLNHNKPPTRGALPWELNSGECSKKEPTCAQSDRKPKQPEESCPCDPSAEESPDCEVLRKPKRTSYKWERPPVVQRLMDKTVCELRRLEKCLKLFGDPEKCKNLGPNCSKTKKVYPLREIVEKKSLPGCVIPIKENEKN